MRLEKISVKNLFGSLNHDIPLGKGGITFIHGPNGCGKTTLLRLVYSFLTGEMQILKSIDFSELQLHYSDAHTLVVTRSVKKAATPQLFEDEEDALAKQIDVSIRLDNPKGKELFNFEYSKQMQKAVRTRQPFPMSQIERRLPFLTRVSPQQWVDTRIGQSLSLEDVIVRYGERLNITGSIQWPDWMSDRINSSKVDFVQTQRLINLSAIAKATRMDETKESREVVENYSQQIKETIAKKLAESAVQSQERDRSFPFRLLNKEFPTTTRQSDFLKTYRDTEERAQNLMTAGLLDQAPSIPLPDRKLTKAELEVLALYLADFNEKLDAFTDLQQRIETLVDIVGAKLRRKKFIVDRKSGFVFETPAKTPEGKPGKLAVTDLSSGEQHQIVLFYELIFASTGIKLFLIDEPEISLHVEWQRAFIKDIERVQKLTGASFLIATHSPQIINHRRDLAVPLDGGLPI